MREINFCLLYARNFSPLKFFLTRKRFFFHTLLAVISFLACLSSFCLSITSLIIMGNVSWHDRRLSKVKRIVRKRKCTREGIERNIPSPEGAHIEMLPDLAFSLLPSRSLLLLYYSLSSFRRVLQRDHLQFKYIDFLHVHSCILYIIVNLVISLPSFPTSLFSRVVFFFFLLIHISTSFIFTIL